MILDRSVCNHVAMSRLQLSSCPNYDLTVPHPKEQLLRSRVRTTAEQNGPNPGPVNLNKLRGGPTLGTFWLQGSVFVHPSFGLFLAVFFVFILIFFLLSGVRRSSVRVYSNTDRHPGTLCGLASPAQHPQLVVCSDTCWRTGASDLYSDVVDPF